MPRVGHEHGRGTAGGAQSGHLQGGGIADATSLNPKEHSSIANQAKEYLRLFMSKHSWRKAASVHGAKGVLRDGQGLDRCSPL